MSELVKINNLEWPADQVAFYRDFINTTQGIPDGQKKRVWKNTVVIELSSAFLGISLDNINAKTPKHGHGTRAMAYLTKLADKHKVSIFADAVPEDMSTEKLKKWYKDNGFEHNGGCGMRYKPP